MDKGQKDGRTVMGNDIIHVWKKYADLDDGDRCGVLEAVKTSVTRGLKLPVDTVQNQLHLEMFEDLEDEDIVKSHEELNLFQKIGGSRDHESAYFEKNVGKRP